MRCSEWAAAPRLQRAAQWRPKTEKPAGSGLFCFGAFL